MLLSPRLTEAFAMVKYQSELFKIKVRRLRSAPRERLCERKNIASLRSQDFDKNSLCDFCWRGLNAKKCGSKILESHFLFS